MMEQVVVGADDSIRALARVAIVRAGAGGEATAPWSDAQRAALHAFAGRSFVGSP